MGSGSGDKRRPINITFERFVVGFFAYYVIYVVLLFMLLVYFTPMDAWVWFFVIQSTMVAIVIIVQQLAPNFVELSASVPIFMAVKPVVFVTEIVHNVGLGIVTEMYGKDDASFWWIFPLLITMQCFKFLSLGLVQVDLVHAETTTPTQSRFKTTYSIPIATHIHHNFEQWRRAAIVQNAM
jgi:hypothetical protein